MTVKATDLELSENQRVKVSLHWGAWATLIGGLVVITFAAGGVWVKLDSALSTQAANTAEIKTSIVALEKRLEDRMDAKAASAQDQAWGYYDMVDWTILLERQNKAQPLTVPTPRDVRQAPKKP